MKKYAFIGYIIASIGGSQIYFYNKEKYLRKNGWDVYIFSGYKGPIYIDSLKKYENLINTDLNEFPYILPKHKVNTILEQMLKSIDYKEGDEVVVECDGLKQAFWGELLAKKCNGRCIIHYLGEKINASDKINYDFLEFKFDRKELYCINAKIIKDVFYNKNLTDEQQFVFRAPCTNSMEDVEIPIKLDLKPNAPVIGIIGRISKDYVFSAISEIIKFAKNHPDKFYNVLIVGGTEEKDAYTTIENLSKNAENIKVIITGRLYPVPQKLIEKINIAIGSSGSIRLPWSLNIPSVSVDLNTNKAIGFLGYDTKNTQFASPDDHPEDISCCLENFFYNSYIENHKGPYEAVSLASEKSITDTLDIHMEYLEKASSEKKYFTDFKACSLKALILKTLYLFGGRKLIGIFKNIRKILKKN